MTHWTNICVEAFCFGESKDDKYPCGKNVPSSLCLSNHMCPHLAFSNTKEREVAQFVPFRLILLDRISSWAIQIKDELVWLFWDSLWFNRRKTDEFFKSIKTISSKDCPELKEFEDSNDKAQEEFLKWFPEALKEEQND